MSSSAKHAAQEIGPVRRRALQALTLGLVVGGGWMVLASGDPAAPTTSSVADEPRATPTVTPSVAPGREASGPFVPRRMLLESLGVEAPMVPIASAGAVLTPPPDAAQLGWWRDGAKPGARAGTVLVTGHTVQNAPAVFNELGRLATGDRVEVRGKRGLTTTYVVTDVATVTRAQLARRAPRLFDPDGPARLVLVTCAGWNGASYDANTVVTARPEA